MAAKDPKKDPEAAALFSPTQFGTDEMSMLKTSMLEECLHNVIHDLVLEVHREEKIARARSAVILAEDEAKRVDSLNATADGILDAASAGVKVETAGAIYENGRVRLKGNPLETTTDVMCPRCRRPRVVQPTFGRATMKIDPSREYCARHPPIQKAGHDIWGNPFVTSTTNSNKAKKDKEKESKEKGALAGLADSPNATPPPASTAKVAVTFPSVKCPNCPRYLFVTRLASHLEKCMGLTGRNASRNAMAKMDSSQNRNSSTPMGSRLGTPTPRNRASPSAMSRDEDEDDEDDDDDDEVVKKKRKKAAPRKPNEKIQPLKLKKAKELGGGDTASPMQRSLSQSSLATEGKASPVKRARDVQGEDEDTPKTKKAKRTLDPGGALANAKMKELTGMKKSGGSSTPKALSDKGGARAKNGRPDAALDGSAAVGKDDDPFRDAPGKRSETLGPPVEV